MNKTNSIRLFVGLALAAVGIVLFLSHNPKQLSASAADLNYSSKWQATKLITMCCWGNNKYVAIGVSEWKVNGTVGSKTYTETWKVPTFNNAKFTTINGQRAFTGIDVSKWMTGAVRMWGSNDLTFIERDVATVIAESSTTNKTEHTDVSGGTGGEQCSGSDVDCRHVSGAYGWTDGESLGGGRSSSQPRGGGVFMPLEWNVTGTVTQ